MLETQGNNKPQRKFGVAAAMGEHSGQVAFEFLAMAAMGILMLSVALLMYSAYRDAAEKNRTALEVQSLCSRTANIIAGTGSLGDGARTKLAMHGEIYAGNYTVWIVGNSSVVRVEYLADEKKAGVSCRFPKINITNSSSTGGSSRFSILGNETISNKGGVLVFVQ